MIKLRSPSAKRAWIEMCRIAYLGMCSGVALCEEGVDRNTLRLYQN